MLSEEEQSVLEYARFHGLTIDHTKLDPFENLERPSKPYPDDSHLPQINFADFVPKPERLTITKNDLRYLSAALETPAKPDLGDLLMTRWHVAQDLRMELPLHHKDPQVNVTSYFSGLKRWKQEFYDSKATENTPSKSRKATASPKLNALCARVQNALASERLVFSKEDMLFLQQCMKPPSKDIVKACHEEILSTYEKSIPSPMHSPLMPRYPEVELPPLPDIPPLPPMNEDVEDPAKKCRRIDEELLERDNILDTPTRNTIDEADKDNNLGAIYSPLKHLIKPPLAEVAKIRETTDLRMEEPVTPPDREKQHQRTLALTAPKILEEMGVHLPSPVPSPEDTSAKALESLMRDIEPIATKVNHAIEHEQLSETRIACKMKLPEIEDVHISNAPWKVYEMADSDERERMKNGFLGKVRNDLSKYSNERMKELESKLRWLSARDLEPKEEIMSDVSLEEWFAVPPHPDLSGFAWRPEHDALSDSESDLEEIETADLPNPSEMSVLLKRRKMDACKLSSSNSSAIGVRSDCHEIDICSPKRLRRTSFSPMGAVDDFLAARSGYTLEQKPARNAPESMLAETSWQLEVAPNDTIDLSPHEDNVNIEVPLPPIPVEPPIAWCIVSSTFMSLRGLVRHFQRLYPTLDLVERDFGAKPTRFDSRTKPDSFPKAYSSGSPCNDVDIIISPTLGILLTTAQKLHQRPLPGSNAPQALQARLVSIAPKYESVILVVSQNLNQDVAPAVLTASDSAAMAEISAFSRSAYFKALNTEVSVVLSVGGERHLAHWLAAYVAQQSPSLPNMMLKLEETPWEVWLRHMGLNAFAAQALLASLSGSGTSGGLNERAPGLAEWVRMEASERIRRFSGLLGSSIIDRVNKALGTRWG